MAQYERVQYNDVLSNVSLECIRGPTSCPSNELARCAGLCEGSGAACTHRLACDIGGAVGAQAMQKPGARGDGAVLLEPQLWVEWEQAIA